MEKIENQAEMFANRLKKRFRHLKKWAKRTGAGGFRLYDRDIPEIPLVLDIYGDVISGALYKRPYEKDENEEAVWLDVMRASAAQALGLTQENIIIKCRERQKGKSQYEKIAGEGLIRIIDEGGLKFKVNLSDYLDTGLFLEKRALRRAVREDSAGKRVLNLFCYTGSFSVYAAAGGASGGAVATDSVDLSNTYLGWAKENFILNGLQSDKHRLIRSDVSLFLKKAAAAKMRWDMIILDPPAFSNSSMAIADIDLRRDYGDLLAACLVLLSSGGKLIFSAGARSFKATAAEIETALAERFPGITVTDLSDKYIDEDFHGKKTPKIFLLTKN